MNDLCSLRKKKQNMAMVYGVKWSNIKDTGIQDRCFTSQFDFVEIVGVHDAPPFLILGLAHLVLVNKMTFLSLVIKI